MNFFLITSLNIIREGDFLDPGSTYCCVPFSCAATIKEDSNSPFRLTCYSAKSTEIESATMVPALTTECIRSLHRILLSQKAKIIYPVADRCILACVQGISSVVFLAVNGTERHFLSVKLTIDVQDGMVLSFGSANDTHDIPPCLQRIIAVVSGDGKLSPATQLTFQYMSSTVPTKGSVPHKRSEPKAFGINLKIDTVSRSLIEREHTRPVQERGSESIDTFLWIPQIGSSTVSYLD